MGGRERRRKEGRGEEKKEESGSKGRTIYFFLSITKLFAISV